MAQDKHATEEFETSVSDQAGLLRSRIPTPMLKRIGAAHGDKIHFTVTGKDTVEVKILKGRGKSGDKYEPPAPKEKPAKKAAKKSAKKGGAKKGAKKGAFGKGQKGPIEKPGASKKGGKGRKTKVEYDTPEGEE
jgi:hypothetical protein